MAGIQHHRHGRSLRRTIPLVDAAVAGTGVGAILWFNFGPVGWSIIVVALVAFLLGRIGARGI